MRRALLILALVLACGTGVTSSGADYTGGSASPGNTFAAAADFNTVAVTLANLGSSVTALEATATSERGIARVRFQTSPAGWGAWTDACNDTQAPYTCDLAGVADGVRDLRAIAVDQAGYERTSAVLASRRIDNTSPTAGLADPGYLTGTKSLWATGSDSGSGLASLAIEHRAPGGTWTTLCTGAGSPRSCSLSTAGLPDGPYELRARATDAAGNAAESSLTRVVDNTAPTGSVPPPGPLGGQATVGILADDGAGSGVARVTAQFRYSGFGGWTDACVDTEAPFECAALDTTELPDGLYEARAIVEDRVGLQTTTAVVTVRLDNTRPTTATLASPAAVLTGSVALSGTAADAGSGIAAWTVQYRTGGGAWTDACSDAAAPFACSWATTDVADGSYELRAFAEDQAGNGTASAPATVRVDNTAPRGTDVQAFNGGSTAGRLEAGDTIRFTWSEPIAPASVLAGWSGGSQAIRVNVADGGSADTMDFASGSTRLALAEDATGLNLGRSFITSSTAAFNATMTMSGSTITVTLGSRINGTLTTATAGTMTWRPSASVRDLAGFAATTGTVTESGASDRDF